MPTARSYLGDPDFVRCRSRPDVEALRRSRCAEASIRRARDAGAARHRGRRSGPANEGDNTTHFRSSTASAMRCRTPTRSTSELRPRPGRGRHRRPAQQRARRFRRQARRAQCLRPRRRRRQCPARQAAAVVDDADHRAEGRQAVPGHRLARRQPHHHHRAAGRPQRGRSRHEWCGRGHRAVAVLAPRIHHQWLPDVVLQARQPCGFEFAAPALRDAGLATRAPSAPASEAANGAKASAPGPSISTTAPCRRAAAPARTARRRGSARVRARARSSAATGRQPVEPEHQDVLDRARLAQKPPASPRRASNVHANRARSAARASICRHASASRRTAASNRPDRAQAAAGESDHGRERQRARRHRASSSTNSAASSECSAAASSSEIGKPVSTSRRVEARRISGGAGASRVQAGDAIASLPWRGRGAKRRRICAQTRAASPRPAR
jgi:hypothetical protein